MKVTDVTAFEVVVPAHAGSWHSPEYGEPGYDTVPVTIIQVHTDEGSVGLGEVSRGIPRTRTLEYASGIIGADPLELNLQSLPIGDFFDPADGIYDAYEMAIYDIVGKVRGEPAYKLFGGAYRDRVLVSVCSGEMTPGDAARKAREAVDAGYRYLKMKATDTSPVVERIAAIREQVGEDLKVVIDPMQRLWRPAVMDDLCFRLTPFRDSVQCFEDPFNKKNYDWYRIMREKVHFPLAIHLHDIRDVLEAIKREACDYLNLGASMADFHRIGVVAEAAGIPVWHGSSVGLGISEAAILHVSAATKACTLSSDVVGEKIRTDDLITEPIRFQDGHALVPQGPGLGVELDMRAVDKYRVS